MQSSFSSRQKSFLFALTALAGILGVVGFLGSHYALGVALPASRYHVPESAHAQLYRLIVGEPSPNTMPWLYDGKYVARAVVLDAWPGDTQQNLNACKKKWLYEAPYRALCRQIRDVEIIAVKITDIDTDDILLVPVERIAKLGKGAEVVIQPGAMTADGIVTKLPSLLNVRKWNPGPLIQAQD